MTESTWPKTITAITLFVEDLVAARTFYREVFDLPVHFEDDASAVFRFGDVLVNLLRAEAGAELIGPARIGPPHTGARFQLTITVEDVDAVCAQLERRGVQLLNGPVDRPWGVRTAAFADPAGHVWEIAR